MFRTAQELVTLTMPTDSSETSIVQGLRAMLAELNFEKQRKSFQIAFTNSKLEKNNLPCGMTELPPGVINNPNMNCLTEVIDAVNMSTNRETEMFKYACPVVNLDHLNLQIFGEKQYNSNPHTSSSDILATKPPLITKQSRPAQKHCVMLEPRYKKKGTCGCPSSRCPEYVTLRSANGDIILPSSLDPSKEKALVEYVHHTPMFI